MVTKRRIAGALLCGALVAAGCSVSERAEPETDSATPSSVAVTDESSSTTGQSGSGVTENADPSAFVPPPIVEPTDPWPQIELALLEVARLEGPIDLVGRPGTDDLYVAERVGRVRRLVPDPDDDSGTTFTVEEQPVLDLTGSVSTEGEQGLLGIEFSSDGRSLYVSYTDLDGTSTLVEFDMQSETSVDAEDARLLLQVDQPFMNHNGGQVRLGSDGFLYWGLGDGGGGGDPEENGQNPSTLLGSLVRIDPFPAGDQPYGIPPTNPFLGTDAGAPEVFAYGLRNPWRFSFDPMDGTLWIADVGQETIEEINVADPALGGGLGANYGWSLLEGTVPYKGDAPPDAVPPLLSVDHSDGDCSVIGGHVYRGPTMPTLDGIYIFGDFCSGILTGIQRSADSTAVADFNIAIPHGQLWAFGQDRDGEMYVLLADGVVAKIVPAGGGGGNSDV